MRKLLQRLFPHIRSARGEWKRRRPSHFRLFPASPPPPLQDLPPGEIERTNLASEKYFQRRELREYWLNKPFSDREQAGWYLWRFGLLLTGLNPRTPDRVLDFGCGTGWTSHMLARMGAEVVGVDISSGALELARESAERSGPLPDGASLRFEHFNGDCIPAPDQYFDFVIVFEAIHHLPNPQALLREFARVLSPHGLVGFAEPGVGHSESEISGAEAGQGILEQDLDVERVYQSARAAGFREMELFVPGIHPHNYSLPMSRVRWFLRGISWLVPSNYTRLAILTGPIGILRKGPYAVTSIHPRSHTALIRTTVPAVASPSGAMFDLPLTVTNPTETVWLKEGWRGRGCVRAGAHLMSAAIEMLELDYGRADLPRDILPGASACVSLRLRAPANPGRYVVRIDMVNEGISWFERHGSRVVDVLLDVDAAS